MGSRLLVQGTNVLDAIANAWGAGAALDPTSHIQVASVVAAGVTASESGASAFQDLEATNLLVNTVRPP